MIQTTLGIQTAPDESPIRGHVDAFPVQGLTANEQDHQRFTNEIREPNANERKQTDDYSSVSLGLAGASVSLITVWLQVRVLPGPTIYSWAETLLGRHAVPYACGEWVRHEQD
jgi:hypothetical protein